MNLESVKIILLVLLFAICGSNGAEKVLYSQNFESAIVGSLPKDMVVLDGRFSVKEENGNKFLELRGVPLDNYGVLFGEEIDTAAELTVRVRGEASGKRYPSFCAGLYGAGGFKLRLSPARRAVELFKGDELKASAPFEWKFETNWIYLKLRASQIDQSRWVVSGSAWYGEKTNQPPKWQVKFETEKPSPGKASVRGIPYSSKPIHFDDITLVKIEE